MNDSETCVHNARCRYSHGFYCEDCNTFFAKDSPTYRSGELLGSIWCVLNNINANSIQAGGPRIEDALDMMNKIGIGLKHANYEELIAGAELVMKKYNVNSDSASVVLK